MINGLNFKITESVSNGNMGTGNLKVKVSKGRMIDRNF